MVSAPRFPLVLLLSAHAALIFSVASTPTYEDKDPITGKPVQCDRCPPGTFMRSRCSSVEKTQCSPCPEGSYTQLWNYINKCLRCATCSRNQVVKKECTTHSDCVCECKQGYYYSRDYDMCFPHSECPSGQGVLTEGTAEHNTVCHICPDGTYSNISSAHQKCMAHKNCSSEGLQMVLKGSTRHDSLCANCPDVKDAAEYLREIFQTFFVHPPMKIQRLRRLVNQLPSEDGKKPGAISRTELHARINTWTASATASQIHKFISVLTQTKASNVASRLQKKLEIIARNLAEQCHLESMSMVN